MLTLRRVWLQFNSVFGDGSGIVEGAGVYNTGSLRVLRSRIEGSGQISGDYTTKELDYLIRTLNAGSLRVSERATTTYPQEVRPGVPCGVTTGAGSGYIKLTGRAAARRTALPTWGGG